MSPAGATAHFALQPFNGFQVVVEAGWLGVQHGLQPLALGVDGRCFIAVASPKIGGEHLNSHQRVAGPNRCHRLGEQAGTVIALIVPGDSGKHHVAELQRLDRLGHTLCFEWVQWVRGLSFVDLAEGTAAGADRAPKQEGGGAGGVALAAVGTASFFANGVQPLLLHHPLHSLKIAGIADGAAQPFRQPLSGGDGAVAGGGWLHRQRGTVQSLRL